MLTLADTHKAKRRRKLDKEKEDLMTEIMQQQQKSAEASKMGSYHGFQSAPKSHYMYNVPLIPKVVCFLTEVIIIFIIIIMNRRFMGVEGSLNFSR